MDQSLSDSLLKKKPRPPVPADPGKPTAVLLIGPSFGAGMHTLLAIDRLFPRHFRNFVFVSVAEVDARSYGAEEELDRLDILVRERLDRFTGFCHDRGLGTASYSAFGSDVAEELTVLVERVVADFPNSVIFAPRLLMPDDNWATRWLHNQTALTVQRRLHLRGIQMMVVPMRLD